MAKEKYIDAEKLKAEIERLQRAAAITMEELQMDEPSERMRGELDAYDDILYFIDSLQQEQPEVDLEMEIDDYTTEQYHKVFDGTGTLDEFDWVDVASVIEDTARHFYELGLNARKKE